MTTISPFSLSLPYRTENKRFSTLSCTKTVSTQTKLCAGCFVQSCFAVADFVIFSNYCLIGTRPTAPLFSLPVVWRSLTARGFVQSAGVALCFSFILPGIVAQCTQVSRSLLPCCSRQAAAPALTHLTGKGSRTCLHRREGFLFRCRPWVVCPDGISLFGGKLWNNC